MEHTRKVLQLLGKNQLINSLGCLCQRLLFIWCSARYLDTILGIKCVGHEHTSRKCAYPLPCWKKLQVKVKSLSHLTLCDPMDCSLPGSSVHGIFQATVLEWVAIAFSRVSSRPRDRTRVSLIVDRRFTIWATEKRLILLFPSNNTFRLFLSACESVLEELCPATVNSHVKQYFLSIPHRETMNYVGKRMNQLWNLTDLYLKSSLSTNWPAVALIEWLNVSSHPIPCLSSEDRNASLIGMLGRFDELWVSRVTAEWVASSVWAARGPGALSWLQRASVCVAPAPGTLACLCSEMPTVSWEPRTFLLGRL